MKMSENMLDISEHRYVLIMKRLFQITFCEDPTPMIDQERIEKILKANQIFSILGEEDRRRLIPLLSVAVSEMRCWPAVRSPESR